jgi:DNA polymerase III sliding clamp (beta) subunit (PCNA family)
MPCGLAGSFISTTTTTTKERKEYMNKEIVIPVCDLKAALPGLSKIVGKSRTLPVLQSVRVSRDAEGNVSLMGTDLDAFATYTVKEAQSGPAVDMLVPLEQLTKTVKGMKAEGTITLIPDGKEKVKLWYSIAGNQVRQSVNALRPDEFPPVPKVNQPSIPLEPGFGLALRQALECCSEDSTRAILKGACLDVRESKLHYVVASNGRCLYSANSFCFDVKKSVIIPDSKFLEWPDLMDDEETASLSVEPGQEAQPAKDGKPATEATPGWVKFQCGPWTFITKEIFGEFPNWKQAVPVTDARWTHVSLSEQAIKQLLLVTPNLPGDDGLNHPVRLRITNQYLNLEGRNSDDEDWTSISVDAVIKGKPITVALNRRYLLNALRFGLNQVEIEDPLSPVVFSNGGKKMVIMPVNLEGPKVAATTPAAASSGATAAATPPAEQTASQEQPGAPTEERTAAMPRTARATTPEPMTTFQPVETHASNNGNGNGNGNGSTVKSLVDHVEQIKENLKNVIRDLNGLIDTVKLADKERKSSEKEIESIRTKLRQIQSVAI